MYNYVYIRTRAYITYTTLITRMKKKKKKCAKCNTPIGSNSSLMNENEKSKILKREEHLKTISIQIESYEHLGIGNNWFTHPNTHKYQKKKLKDNIVFGFGYSRKMNFSNIEGITSKSN